MTKSPTEQWARVREIVRLLPPQRHAMKHGETSPIRDHATRIYVQLVDELADLMIDLDGSDTLEDIGIGLEVVYGRIGG